MSEQHVTEIYERGEIDCSYNSWTSYGAKCSCGWNRYWKGANRRKAEEDAAQHRHDVLFEAPDEMDWFVK